MKKTLIFYTFITLLFFGLLIKLEFATDTYAVFNFDKKAVFMQYAMSGRFVTGIVFKILKNINISEKLMYVLSYTLAIICTILSQYYLYEIVSKDVREKYLNLLIPTLIIINPFSIELFLFIEKGIMWFGVLMCIVAVKNIIQFFETRQNKHIIYSIFSMFIANCSYQGVVGIFVAILLVYILKLSKNIKDFLINNIIVGNVYAIPAIIDYLLVKVLFKSSRINGKINIIESIKIILKNTFNMTVKTYEILPKYAFILLILFTFTVFCSKIWKEKKRILNIAKILYIIFGVTFFAILPQIIQPTNSIWFVPRVTYCFASMYGILVLFIAIKYNVDSFSKNLILIISFLLIFFQGQKFIKVEKDRYILNKQDEQISMRIVEQINNYETQTGNKIECIAVYQDKNPNYTYEGIFAIGDMNIKCYYTDWSTIEILKYYVKRDLKLVKKDEKIEKNFKKQDWDKFNSNQIIFKENTINICNY